MSWKTESLALVFGILMVLIIFGDGAQDPSVGNLDAIFGQSLWPATDVLYPLASIAIFLLYGKSKGRLQFHPATILVFLAFLAGLAIIQFDDIFVALYHSITLPQVYWNTARVLYLIIAPGTFLAFGSVCRKLNQPLKSKSESSKTL